MLKYGFSASALPFLELRPASTDHFVVPVSAELIRSSQDKMRALIMQAARAKGCRIWIQVVPGGLRVQRMLPRPKGEEPVIEVVRGEVYADRIG